MTSDTTNEIEGPFYEIEGPFKKTRHTKRKGRCFELSANYMHHEDSEHYILVHGYRWITGTCNHANAHGWVEDPKTQTVYDLVENKIYDRDEYYFCNIIHNITTYTFMEAMLKIAETGRSGPWHDPPGPWNNREPEMPLVTELN